MEGSVEQGERVPQEGKISVDILHETKPSANLSINKVAKTAHECSQDESNKIETTPPEEFSKNEPGDSPKTPNFETVFKKLEISSDSTDSTVNSPLEGKEVITPPSSDSEENKKSISNLYSVKGTPSGRIRRHESSSNVFPVGCMGCKEDVERRRLLEPSDTVKDFAGHIDNTPKKRLNSAKVERNPVTGAGIQEKEYRRSTLRKKDGNPLLGTGYDEKPAPASNCRIPPGGYSQGLW